MRWMFFATALVGCSTDFAPRPCAADGDCAGGTVCELRDQAPVCVHAEDAPLVIGESAPVSGTNQALGTGMKLGIELAFDEQNAAGGIRGRKLVLDFRDDAYDPPTAEAAARDVHRTRRSRHPIRRDVRRPRCPSPTATAIDTDLDDRADARPERGARVPRQRRHADDGARGAGRGRDRHALLRRVHRRRQDPARQRPPARARSTSSTSARATPRRRARRSSLSRSAASPSYTHLISFDQNDTFGDAGYNGLVAAYVVDFGAFPSWADPTTPIARFRYTRNDDTSVPAQAAAAEAYLATPARPTTRARRSSA